MEVRWSERDLAPRDFVPYLPSGFDDRPFVQFTSFRGWQEVARWGAAMYARPQGIEPAVRAVADTIAQILERPDLEIERQIELSGGEHPVVAHLIATGLASEAGQPRGAMLFLENVTDLLRVQRMEAWREVARRLAHEIKNPLTPIQLSAQRLRKRYLGQLDDASRPVFDECTRTIIGQVVDQDGKPVPGAAVRATAFVGPDSQSYRTPDGTPARILADDQGRFKIEGLAPGTYHVRVHAGDRNHKLVITVGDAAQQQIDLKLK